MTAETNGTPLHSGYSFFFMRRGKGSNASKTDDSDGPAPNPYENSIKKISDVTTVEEFWGTYNYLVRPNDLPTTTDYHFFRKGIKPTWEDPSNAKGGKWIVRLRKGLASRYWEESILALIGGQYSGVPEGEICGVVISIRSHEDILGIWNKTANDRDMTERIREAVKKTLQLPSVAHMEYKPHQNSLADKSSFRNTTAWKPKSLDGRSQSHGETRRSSWADRDKPNKHRDSDRQWR